MAIHGELAELVELRVRSAAGSQGREATERGGFLAPDGFHFLQRPARQYTQKAQSGTAWRSVPGKTVLARNLLKKCPLLT